MSNSETLVDRRKFMLGTTATLAMAAVSATAATKDHDHHEHHVYHQGKNPNLVETAQACVTAGKTCLNHCLILLGEGDTSLKDCARSVNEMVPVCEAMTVLALADSKNLKAMAELCLAVCEDCQSACKEHKDHHAECKDCYEACKSSIAAVKAFLNAA